MRRAHIILAAAIFLIATGLVASLAGTVAGYLGGAAAVVIYASYGAVRRVFAEDPDDDEEPVTEVPWIAPVILSVPYLVPGPSSTVYAPRLRPLGDGAELVEDGPATMVLTREPEAAVEPDAVVVTEYSPPELAAYAEGWHDCLAMLNGGEPTDGPQPDPVA